MIGAREYAELLGTGHFGRLYYVSGEHARGKTFHLFVLPQDGNRANAVEVYGITGGHPGWTETYGWLHRGKWERDFDAFVEVEKAARAENELESKTVEEARAAAEKRRTRKLLNDY